MRSDVRIVHNKLLGGWFIVRGSHDTPLGGRFDSKAQAQAHLQRDRSTPKRGIYASGREAVARALAKPVKTLRQACIERGIDPDNTGVKSTKQRWLNVDRIIPGVADKQAAFLSNQRDANGYRLRRANARRMYTRQSAANDRELIALSDMPVAAYVAAFCRLNNLKEG